MSKALDPGEAVSEAVHVLKGDQRASCLLVPSRLVSRSNCSCVKTNSFYLTALHVCPVSSDLQHVVEHGAPTQLRFERHLSVHNVFLNMWGEGNHRRQCYKLLAA